MEPKKSPKADLTKNSGLYFAIGLALVTLISWRALEWKKYDKSENYGDYSQNVEELLDEEVPLTPDFKTPPPPPQPPTREWSRRAAIGELQDLRDESRRFARRHEE